MTDDPTAETWHEIRTSGPPRSPLAAALLNLTGLGLGYAYLRRWWRTTFALVGTALLAALAYVPEVAGSPWVWRTLGVLWLAALGYDGWRAVRHGPHLHGVRPQLVPVGVGIALIAAAVVGTVVYVAAASRAYAAGVTAQRAGDGGPAVAEFERVSGPYRLILGPDVVAAEQRTEQCADYLAAQYEQRRGAHAAAVRHYREFRTAHPGSDLVPLVDEQLVATFLSWGETLRNNNDGTGAISVYRDALTDTTAPERIRPELAWAHLERAEAARARVASGGPAMDAMAAVDDLLTIRRALGDTPAVGRVSQALTATFAAATAPVSQQRYCDVLDVLASFVALSGNEAAEVVGPATEMRMQVLLECGLQRFRAADFRGALSPLHTLVSDYPQAPQTAQARSAIIAAEVAVAKQEMGGGPPPALPAPLAGNAPGQIPVRIFNGSPH